MLIKIGPDLAIKKRAQKSYYILPKKMHSGMTCFWFYSTKLDCCLVCGQHVELRREFDKSNRIMD
ncbi:MAG TPA: hypothetical protein VHA33_19460 [Candidatus Angelobacter sp.]|nr:hypothetical protein [Candidatus Angelobacter sp.]